MDEKRTEPRMRRLKEARIIFNGRKSVLTCIMRDATAAGARVTIGEAHQVPAEFEFAVTGEAPRPARRVWLRRGELGLAFTS